MPKKITINEKELEAINAPENAVVAKTVFENEEDAHQETDFPQENKKIYFAGAEIVRGSKAIKLFEYMREGQGQNKGANLVGVITEAYQDANLVWNNQARIETIYKVMVDNDLPVYVPQHFGSVFQAKNAQNDIGKRVRVKVITMLQTDKHTELATNYQDTSEYIALGSIKEAEYLYSAELKRGFEAKDEKVIAWQQGVIVGIYRNSQINNSTGKEEERSIILVNYNGLSVSISYDRFSYAFRSNVVDIKDIVQIGKTVEFKFRLIKEQPATAAMTRKGVKGNYFYISGQRRSLEEPSQKKLQSLLDNKVLALGATLISSREFGYVCELDGIYGLKFNVTVKDGNVPSQADVERHAHISVIINPKDFHKNENGVIIGGKVTYISTSINW